MIIDAHAHLWDKQNGFVNGKPVFPVGNGKSNFGGEIRQMMPPYMNDDINSVERFIANMDYAGVNGAVITQEEIDGNQNSYLLSCKDKFPDRIKICSLYKEGEELETDGFDGIKLCSCRFKKQNLLEHFSVFELADKQGKFISIDMADGALQTAQLDEIAKALPELKIAVGHFGMVTVDGWQEQIKLARNKNVFVESGGITWLFNKEFYPYPSAIKAIREAIDICGADKLMWGSDYPRTMVEITYKMSYDFITKSDELTDDEKKKILFENACSFYGFDNLPTLDDIPNML